MGFFCIISYSTAYPSEDTHGDSPIWIPPNTAVAVGALFGKTSSFTKHPRSYLNPNLDYKKFFDTKCRKLCISLDRTKGISNFTHGEVLNRRLSAVRFNRK